MSGQLDILVIDAGAPDPGGNAGDRAVVDLLDSLIRLGHRVVFITVDVIAGSEALLDALKGRGIEVLHPDENRSAGVQEALDGHDWNVVMAHRPTTGVIVEPMVARTPGGPPTTVYWGSDVHSWRLNSQMRLIGDVPRDQLLHIGAIERRNWSTFDLCVYPADWEATVVDNYTGVAGRGRAAPYFRLDGADLRRGRSGPQHRSGCLMVGGAAHRPNHDAVRHAVTDILPLLRERRPGCHLTVVGDWPEVEREELQRPGVHFVGRVPDEELLALHHSHLCLLAPLRFGAGTRRKIVAAMGLGLPVVTTPEGARGALVRNATVDDGVVIASGAEQTASEVFRLITDPALWERQASRAHHSAAAVYSTAAFDAEMARTLDTAITRGINHDNPALTSGLT